MAAKVLIDNWRWADVPFYIRTGKRLARRVTEMAIKFRRAPHLVFRGQGLDTNSLGTQYPARRGHLHRLSRQVPGQEMRLTHVAMDFSYRAAFGGGERSAYATLFNDCMRGDATLFDRADGVEAAWAFVDPILEAWAASGVACPIMRPEAGVRARPTNYWSVMVDTGVNRTSIAARNSPRRVRVRRSPPEVARTAARRFVEWAWQAIAKRRPL